MLPLIIAAATAALVAWTVRRVRSEPRRLSNAYALIACAVGVWVTLATASRGDDPLTALVLTALLLSPVLATALIVFLVLNGLSMLRREGRRPANMLSLAAAVGIVAAMSAALAFALTSRANPLGASLSLLVVLALGWVGFLFVACLLYSQLYPRLIGRRRLDFIVVHGAGLIRGQVPPLLAARVDRGILRWEEARATNPAVKLIMSGGQGSDESRSEASAMAEYARLRGVPNGSLLLEDRSATTEENLANTRDVVEREIGPGASGLAVTSSYHVLRTALLSRKVGLDVQVDGSPTAGYFWPSAFLREFVAIVALHPVVNALAALLVCLPLPLALLALG